MTKHIINNIFDTIEARKNTSEENSYVSSLFAKGTNKIAEKVGEESTEAIIEAVQGNKEKLAEESADLLFHLMVLWADAGLKPSDIFDILEQRQGVSGLDEKASRQR